jgi:hypothetical protein
MSLISNPDVEVRESGIPAAGLGVFAKRSFKEGEVVCEYTGQVLSLLQALKSTDKSYMMGGFGLNVHLDARECPESMGRYINDPLNESKVNVKFVKIKEERKALVLALRDILVCCEFIPSICNL